MTTKLLNFDYYLHNSLKPYISDISLAFFIGIGIFLYKNFSLKKNNKKSDENKKQTFTSVKLDKWDQAVTLQNFNGLILQNFEIEYDAFTILNKLHKKGLTPNTTTYNCLLEMSFKLNQTDNALNIFDEITDYFSIVNPDIITYNIVLKHYVGELKEFKKYLNISNEKKLLNIFKIISELKKKDIKMNLISFNTAMDGCVEVGDFEKAWQLFNEMKSTDIIPDLYTYSTLVKGLNISDSNDKVEKAIEILNLIKNGSCGNLKPDIVLYNSVLDICVVNNRIEIAEKLFDEMKSGEIKPSLITYSIILKGYGISRNLRKAYIVYEEFLEKNMIPNEIIFGSLMNCAVQCSNFDLMQEIYEKMKELNIQPSMTVYTILIKGFNKMKNFEKSFEIFGSLSEVELSKTNILIYNSILDTCVESGNFDKLKEIYNLLKSTADNYDTFINPNIVTYSTVIKAYINNNLIEEALKIYSFVKENLFKLDEVFFSVIINSLAAKNELDKALFVFEDMKLLNIKRSSLIYSVLIKMYSKANINDDKLIQKALNILTLMKEDGIKPSLIAFTTLIQMFIKRKEIKDAISMFEQIKKEGIQPDSVCYNFIINGCSFNQNLEKAIKYLIESMQKNIKVSEDTFRNVFDYLINNKFMKNFQRAEYAKELMNTMAEKKIRIDGELNKRVMQIVCKKKILGKKTVESKVLKSYENFNNIFQIRK